MASNEIFQYSVVSALMDGVASDGLPLSELLSHGDHGLGTFRFMEGEMIILDGKLYQMKSDGEVVAVDASSSDNIAPFAMVTRFRPTIKANVSFSSKRALADELSQLLPVTGNHYLAFRIEGVFKSVTVRTVCGQDFPGEKLSDVGKKQVSHVFSNARGTAIGFRSPAFLQGVSVAGDHLHFITEDESHGGHVLECETGGEVEVSAAQVWKVHLEFPKGDDQYNKAHLETDWEGIAAVEG